MAVRSSLVVLAGLLVAPMALAGPPPPKAAVHPTAAHGAPAHGHFKTARLAETPHRDKSAEAAKGSAVAAPVGKSVGSPTAGRLVGGAHLTENDHVRVVPVYVPGDSRWGLEALVGMIDRAAKNITKQWPDSKLSIRPGSSARWAMQRSSIWL